MTALRPIVGHAEQLSRRLKAETQFFPNLLEKSHHRQLVGLVRSPIDWRLGQFLMITILLAV